MKERFKRYLEGEFRAIRPTLAAVEYREKVLKQLLDYEQELRIKGNDDDELIYTMCIASLNQDGSFRDKLREFDEKEVKVDNAKRKGLLIGISVVGVAVALVLVYLIMGVTADLWHPGWLLLVGGAFAGIIALGGVVASKLSKSKKYIAMRAVFPVIIALLSVYLFLLLELVGHIQMSWLVFLVMVIVMIANDTVVAFATDFKFRWIELGICMEVCCALLYVIIGLLVPGFWHPGWILCLGGVVGSAVMAAVLVAKHNSKKDKKEKAKIEGKYKKEDESYYTMWKD